MINYYRFQECYKHHKKKEAKGVAYRNCVALHKNIERSIIGRVFPDGKPKHDLYNVSESAIIKGKNVTFQERHLLL